MKIQPDSNECGESRGIPISRNHAEDRDAFGGLFFGVASTPRLGATVYHSNGSAASVQALHNAALDGNTITLPAETFTWSTGVDISKALPQSASLSGPELVGGLSSLGFFVSFGPAIGKLI